MTCPFDIVVFDFDGTLVHSNALKNEGFDLLAENYEGGVEAMKAARAAPGDDRHMVAKRFASELGLDPACAQHIAERYGCIVDRRVTEAPECRGAVKLLQALQAAPILVHLSSATPLVSLRLILEGRGWMNLFDGIHGRPAKKQETLEKLISETGTDPSRIVVIGDGPDDRASANAMQTGFFAVGDRLTDEPLMTLADVHARLLLC